VGAPLVAVAVVVQLQRLLEADGGWGDGSATARIPFMLFSFQPAAWWGFLPFESGPVNLTVDTPSESGNSPF